VAEDPLAAYNASEAGGGGPLNPENLCLLLTVYTIGGRKNDDSDDMRCRVTSAVLTATSLGRSLVTYCGDAGGSG
jgi:hypothetical protein